MMSEQQDRTSLSSQIRSFLTVLIDEKKDQKIFTDLNLTKFTDVFLSYEIFEEDFFTIRYEKFQKLRDDLAHLISWRKEEFIIDVKNDLEGLINDFLKFKELKDQRILNESKYLEDIFNDKNISTLKKTVDEITTRIEEIHLKNKDVLEKSSTLEIAQKRALDIIEEIESKNQSFNILIDEDSNVRIRKYYDDIYGQEISIADKYRNWALIIFALIGGILLLGFLNLSIQNWNHLRDSSYIQIPLGWDSLLKTVMLFSLTTPAWYLTKESSMHRKVAYKAKMLGTELASFPLYSREFRDEERLELRRSLADRFFGQELYSDSKVQIQSDNSIEQIKLLTEANKVLTESLKIKKVVEGS